MILNRTGVLFVALAFAWGSAFSAIEIGLTTLPPILFAALRFDIAAVLFAGLVVVRELEWRPETKTDWLAIAVSGGLLVGGHFAFLFLGQSYVSSAVSAIVLSLTPIVTPPLALLLLPNQRLRAPAVAGLLVGLVGIVVIAVPGGSLDGQILGVALLFIAATVFALGSVLFERLEETLPTISVQAWAMVVGAGLLHGLSTFHPGEQLATVSFPSATLSALLYLGVVSTAGGFLAYFLLLDRVGATELSLVNYATPVIAALVGWALLGEAITATTVLGFALIVTGFGLCKLETLWRVGGPLVGYGPQRPLLADADGNDGDDDNSIVVDGNAYLRDRELGLSESDHSTRVAPHGD
ncbi:EamA family transporter [Natrialba sp. PRR66]|uniref:DMT family transporter n=1 Tax=Natrialba sp. PRR66 TaxID=3098146 RepID=UPI002B1E609B|nr:EamA family transporter [Natrialba sp. PRR66]